MEIGQTKLCPCHEEELNPNEASEEPARKPGGWKAVPFILGNDTFERLGVVGLRANFMVYLLKEYHMDQVLATNVVNIWSGTTNFGTLVGAYISDSYLGRFKTLTFASSMTFLGLICLTLTAVIAHLRPLPCTELQLLECQCTEPTKSQLGFLYTILVLLTIGAGGIRPCNLPFGVDQFDQTTNEGKKDVASFFNWYYFSTTIVVMIAVTPIIYIQDSISWALGLAIPAALMFCAIVLFWIGTRVYVHVLPGGSVFSGIFHVFVAAYKKRGIKLADELHLAVYDPPSEGKCATSKLLLTNEFRYLNKATIIIEGEVGEDGTPLDTWRLCSVQMVEEVKCLIRIIPIWVSGIICLTAVSQQGTFTVSQALTMNRRIGSNFQVPAGSVGVISMFAMASWCAFYDKILVPQLGKITKQEGGVTVLQRMGIGMVLSVLSMIVAGYCETRRRESALSHDAISADGVASISVLWLIPQLVLMGLAEAFNTIGQTEFYNKQFPQHMKSFANSLLFCNIAFANYLSSIIVAIVHKITGTHDRPSWLDKNVNLGRLDNFYYLLAVLGVFNSIYFLLVSCRYHYKQEVLVESVQGDRGCTPTDIEMNKSTRAAQE